MPRKTHIPKVPAPKVPAPKVPASKVPASKVPAPKAPAQKAPSHFDMQASFADALLKPDAPIPAHVLGSGDEVPTKRYGVYRNNVTHSLIEALKSAFPVVLRLVGPGFFTQMAQAFIRISPPTSPLFLEYGQTFPAFIATYQPATTVPYLLDTSICETLYLKAYHARDVDPVAMDTLSQFAPDSMALLHFSTHPSLQFIASKFPIGSLWHTNKYDDEPKSLDMTIGENVIFLRPQFEVSAQIIAPDVYAFFQSITGGKNLGEAAQATLDTFPAFSLEHGLGALFHFGIVTDVHLNQD